VRTRNKIIIIIAAVLWLAANTGLYFLFSFWTFPADNPRVGVIITEVNEISGSENLAVVIRKPVVSGLRDPEFERTLNGKIETQIAVAKEAAKGAADEFWRESKAEGYQPWQYVLYTDYEVKNTEGILSLKVSALLETGGSGMPVTEFYNADLKNSRLLSLGGLFKNDRYRNVIYRVIKKEMDREPESYFAGDFRSISDITKFFIYAGSLYITFSKYEVASGAMGEPEFRIPTEAIRDLLRGEYKVIIK
jgi:hypothetical protein